MHYMIIEVLFLTFSFKKYSHILHPLLNIPSLPFPCLCTPPTSPLPTDPQPPASPQQRAVLPGTSPKQGITNYNQTRHTHHIKAGQGNPLGGKGSHR